MKLPFQFIASLVVFFWLLSCGCLDVEFDLAVIVNPTVAPEKAKVQKALFGSYWLEEEPLTRKKGRDDLFDGEVEVASKTKMLHVGRAGGGFPAGFLRMASVNIRADGKMTVDDSGELFFATKIDDFYVLNFPNPKEPTGVDEEIDLDDTGPPQERATKWIPENYEGYTLMVLKPQPGGAAIYILHEEMLKAEIKAGRLTGDYMTEKEKEVRRNQRKLAKKEGQKFEDTWRPFIVESSSEEWRAFFKRNGNSIINDPCMLLKRVK